MSEPSPEWMSSAEAQRVLRRTPRQLRRYVESGRLRSRRLGTRVVYLRADVEHLVTQLPLDLPDSAPEVQLVPAGELLDYIRELQERIEGYAAREAHLRAQLETRPQLDDTQRLAVELARAQTERAAVQQQLDLFRQRHRRMRSVAVVLLVVLLLALLLLVVAVVAGWTVTVRVGT